MSHTFSSQGIKLLSQNLILEPNRNGQSWIENKIGMLIDQNGLRIHSTGYHHQIQDPKKLMHHRIGFFSKSLLNPRPQKMYHRIGFFVKSLSRIMSH